MYQLQGDPELTLNHEVQESVWVPVSFLADPSNKSTMDWKYNGQTVQVPCFPYRGHIIWGLTLRMVFDLLNRVERLLRGR